MVKIQKKRKGMASLWRRTAAVCGVLTLTASLLAGCGQKENEETQSIAAVEDQSVSPEEQAEADETGEQTNEENAALVENDG